MLAFVGAVNGLLERIEQKKMTNKQEQLEHILQEMESAVVAYSGGTDSTLLLKVAHDCLGERVLAITAVSPSFPAHERAEAETIARLVGARHVFVESDELSDPRYVANTPERCYFCKGHISDLLLEHARREGYRFVVDGNNADDAGDYRPGRRAALERGVRSPLQEVGLTKAEIRGLARELGLPNWNKPSAACLASRIPYGDPITPLALAQIEQAEQVLRRMGLGQLRVRHHAQPPYHRGGQLARIEVEPGQFEAVLAQRDQIVEQLKALGYTFITLDLAGFRSGSMNEAIVHGH